MPAECALSPLARGTSRRIKLRRADGLPRLLLRASPSAIERFEERIRSVHAEPRLNRRLLTPRVLARSGSIHPPPIATPFEELRESCCMQQLRPSSERDQCPRFR